MKKLHVICLITSLSFLPCSAADLPPEAPGLLASLSTLCDSFTAGRVVGRLARKKDLSSVLKWLWKKSPEG